MRTTFAGVSMRARPSYHQQLYPCLKNGAHHTMSTWAAARIANRGLRMWKYPPSWIPVTVLTLLKRGVVYRAAPRGGFGIHAKRSLAISATPAVAGFGPGRRIGSGRKTVGPTVTYPSVHTLPSLPPPALLSLIAQVHPLEIWCASLHDSTAIPSMCSKQTVAAHRVVMTPLVLRRSVPHQVADVVRTTRYSALPLIILS